MGEPQKPIQSWVHKTGSRTLVIEVWERLTQPQEPPVQVSRGALFVASFLIYWVLTVVAIAFDPFGASSVTSRHSQDVLNIVLGPEYPKIYERLYLMKDRADTPQVAVVLIDETTLEQITPEGERKWPAKPSQHAKVLEAILAYKPRAVMVDMLFVDPLVGKVGAFERALRRYDAVDVPLLFAGASQTEEFAAPPSGAVPAMLGKRLTKPDPMPVTEWLWSLSKELEHLHVVSAFIQRDEDGGLRRYPLEGQLKGVGTAQTAAALLYTLEAEKQPQPPDGWMSLLWSLNVNEVNRDWMDCTDVTENILLRTLQAFWSPKALRQSCPSIATVPVLEILVPSEAKDAEARAMIENNIVFYGSQVDGSDIYVTPTHPRLPGVYIHAIALDNLLRMDGLYLQTEALLGPFRMDSDDISLVIGAPMIALIAAVYLTLVAPIATRGILWRALVVRVFMPFVLVLASLPFAWLLLSLRLAPLDWIGLSLFGLPVILLTRQQLGKAIVFMRRHLLRRDQGGKLE